MEILTTDCQVVRAASALAELHVARCLGAKKDFAHEFQLRWKKLLVTLSMPMPEPLAIPTFSSLPATVEEGQQQDSPKPCQAPACQLEAVHGRHRLARL